MTAAQNNANMLDAIQNAGNIYTFRKYAGAWVPVVLVNGKRQTFAHCSTSGGAIETAIKQCAMASGWMQ